MKTGIELITEERQKQISKHGKTPEHDLEYNKHYQLCAAIAMLANVEIGYFDKNDAMDNYCPDGWDESWWENLLSKNYEEKMIIIGALAAGELDRIKLYNSKKQQSQSNIPNPTP